jgi:murein DD-endopeptidase MepM/ murein hydrolase activator NlpD
VKAGDKVRPGQVIGRAGNSGNTSEPHVHVHLQDTDHLVAGEGIPMPFRGYRILPGIEVVESGIPTGGFGGEGFGGQVVKQVRP